MSGIDGGLGGRHGKFAPPADCAERIAPHPPLAPDQAERYKRRIEGISEKSKVYGQSTDIPVVAFIEYLRGKRCEEVVDFIRTGAASKDPGKIAFAVLAYDIEYPFLTPAERTKYREQFLAATEPIYQNSINSKHWMFTRRSVNNWTYGYGGMTVQALLFVGLAFPEHPHSARYVARGEELLTWVLESAPTTACGTKSDKSSNVYPTKAEGVSRNTPLRPWIITMGHGMSDKHIFSVPSSQDCSGAVGLTVRRGPFPLKQLPCLS